MLLRATIVMLVMLNLGAAGWWVFQPAAKPVAASTAPALRLLAEAGVPVATAAAPAAAPDHGVRQDTPAEACLRFGPFADVPAREAAQRALARAGVSVRVQAEGVRAARGWKVYLPAQATPEAAQALAAKLKAAGVSDLFVMNKGADANSIALGRFSSEEAARRRQAELQGKGVQALAEPVGGTPAQAWLDARLSASIDPATLAAIAPAQPLDCAALR